MQYLFTYNPLQYLNAHEAAECPDALAPVGNQSDDITVSALSDLMGAIEKALQNAGSAFKVVCLVDGEYFDNLSTFDREKTIRQINERPLIFAEVRDALPLMYDVFVSCGQKTPDIRDIMVYADYFLRGETLRDGQRRKLADFIQEVRRNES